MKDKSLNILLIITSLFGYLEWSGNNHSFLFQAEAEIISRLFTDPLSIVHPFTILPLLGQLILIGTLFQKLPSKSLTFISIGCLGILVAFMFAVGLISLNYRIIISTIPFLSTSVIAIRHYSKTKL